MRNIRILDKYQLAKLKSKHLDAKISEHKDQVGISYTRIETPDGKVTFHHHKESVSLNLAKYNCRYLPINHTLKSAPVEEHHVEDIPTEIESVDQTTKDPEDVNVDPVEPAEESVENVGEGDQISGDVVVEGNAEELEPVAEPAETKEEVSTEEQVEESQEVADESVEETPIVVESKKKRRK